MITVKREKYKVSRIQLGSVSTQTYYEVDLKKELLRNRIKEMTSASFCVFFFSQFKFQLHLYTTSTNHCILVLSTCVCNYYTCFLKNQHLQLLCWKCTLSIMYIFFICTHSLVTHCYNKLIVCNFDTVFLPCSQYRFKSLYLKPTLASMKRGSDNTIPFLLYKIMHKTMVFCQSIWSHR